MADEANRFLTAYLYENMALEGPHREGVIFTDSGYGDIQWMSGGGLVLLALAVSLIGFAHGQGFSDA